MKDALKESPFPTLSVDELQSRLLDDVALIGLCDFLILKPTQNCLAGLKRSAFTLKCNRLVLANGTASPNSAGNARKSPRTYLSRASACQICRRSLCAPKFSDLLKPGNLPFARATQRMTATLSTRASHSTSRQSFISGVFYGFPW